MKCEKHLIQQQQKRWTLLTIQAHQIEERLINSVCSDNFPLECNNIWDKACKVRNYHIWIRFTLLCLPLPSNNCCCKHIISWNYFKITARLKCKLKCKDDKRKNTYAMHGRKKNGASHRIFFERYIFVLFLWKKQGFRFQQSTCKWMTVTQKSVMY